MEKRSNEIIIGKTKIGDNYPCFIIAEIGINFDGKLDQAFKLIDVAVDAGCNAVKFQLFKSERMYAPSAGKYKTASGKQQSIVDIVKEGELPPEWIVKLKKYTNQKGLEFFSTACDEQSADILEKCDVDAYKIASFEITHIPLLRHIARKRKPVIFSSGCANLDEVVDAMRVFKEEGNKDIVLMHCVGQYPASPETLNLNVINTFKLAFPDAIIGYSDHSINPIHAPQTAVALGAKTLEKHITLDKNLPGPDHSFATNPKELKEMVKAIRKTEEQMKRGIKVQKKKELLGASERVTYPNEQYVRNFAYRTIFAIKDIKKGEQFTKENIVVLRPGRLKRGIDPFYYEILIQGYRATKDITKFNSLQFEDIFFTSLIQS